MLLRFVVKNLFSFRDETEFNLFPNKTGRLLHHKINVGQIDILKLSVVYGANGSGKSNLIKAIELLRHMIVEGKIIDEIDDSKFKLSKISYENPIEIGIEFHHQGSNYYYTIAINSNKVIYEQLAQSFKDKDEVIFERKIENEIQKVTFPDSYYLLDEKNKFFTELLGEKVLKHNELLFTHLIQENYKEEFQQVKIPFEWFSKKLIIILPNTKPHGLSHILDLKSGLMDFGNHMIKSFNTGITKLAIERKEFNSSFWGLDKETIEKIKSTINSEPSKGASIKNPTTGEEVVISKENGDFVIKTLFTEHVDDQGKAVHFSPLDESDGTRRLLDLIPALEGLVNLDEVYLIDEIERSIHPLLIKEIIRKFSHDESTKGQLIFTTHESSLLDQEILRTDEIWFSQKDETGGSKLYSLSDFKVHNTIDIENGYLNGRYGGIPFLSNLKDLNWHD